MARDEDRIHGSAILDLARAASVEAIPHEECKRRDVLLLLLQALSQVTGPVHLASPNGEAGAGAEAVGENRLELCGVRWPRTRHS